MPPKARITRQMIVEAGMELVRQSGAESLNVRAVAGMLGCSTQPVMYQFPTVAALKAAVCAEADAYHSRYLEQPEHENPMLSIGLRYIHFGAEEQHLFRLLFQSDLLPEKDISALLSQPETQPLVGFFAAQTGLRPEEAQRVFTLLFLTVHGCASLLANNSAPYDRDYFESVLSMSLDGAIAAVKGASL